jgi:hypothetical protein
MSDEVMNPEEASPEQRAKIADERGCVGARSAELVAGVGV